MKGAVFFSIGWPGNGKVGAFLFNDHFRREVTFKFTLGTFYRNGLSADIYRNPCWYGYG
jgi:hypothetical protein